MREIHAARWAAEQARVYDNREGSRPPLHQGLMSRERKSKAFVYRAKLARGIVEQVRVP
jgi:hypothetical protein